VIGSSLRRFLSIADRLTLRELVKRTDHSGAKIQVTLIARDGSRLPVQISICPLGRKGMDGATVGMVVTDMTDARRSEEMLRALTHRVVQVQETERAHLALELHDNVTQLLCAVLFRSQALAAKLSAKAGPARQEATQLCEMLGQTAEEVERISRDLRPSVLDHLGLRAALHATSTEFAKRTGISVKLDCVEPLAPLDAASELAFYRILQESLRNVVKHAQARHVIVRLTQQDAFVQLTITDDGVGFAPGSSTFGRKANKDGLGLLGMRERATYVGGTLKIKSVHHSGTEIAAQIPLSPKITDVR
jgi:signal transduction histidine kinase